MRDRLLVAPKDTADSVLPPHGSAAVEGSALPWDSGSIDTAPIADLAFEASAFDVSEVDRYSDAMLLGRGAMGQVDAVHDARLGRQVAMKTIREETRTEGVARRFMREAALTAGLDHPGIVSVYDAGRRADGCIFYTMRLVQGRSLVDKFAAAQAIGERLALLRPFHRACEAVAYAHARMVVHRDLKPANIMLSDFGQVQVVDWGLARRLTHHDPDGDLLVASPSPSPDPMDPADSNLTRVGAVIGTPAYMSPEQARGEVASCATDVWALGAVLFELVTGHRFTDPGAQKRLLTLATDLPELHAIITHAVHAESADRYPDAERLATDLGHYLDGRRVAAHSYSTWQLLRRVVREWRAPLLVALAAVVTIAVVAWTSYRATVAERDRAQTAEVSAQTAETEVRAAAERAKRQFATSLSEQATRALAEDRLAHAAIFAGEALLRDPSSPQARGAWAAATTAPLKLIAKLSLPADCDNPTVSPSGGLLVCMQPDAVSIWRLWPLEHVRRVAITEPKEAAVSDDESTLWVAAADTHWHGGGVTSYVRGHWVRVSDGTVTPERRGEIGPDRRLIGDSLFVTWTAESMSIPLGSTTHDGRLIGCSKGRLQTVATSRERRDVALLCGDGEVRVFDVKKGSFTTAVRSNPPRQATTAVWSPDGRIIVGDVQGGLWTLDPHTGAIDEREVVSAGMVRAIQLSADGTTALLSFDGATPLLWDVANWSPRLRLPAALGRDVTLTADGKTLIAIDGAGQLRRFALGSSPRRVLGAPSGMTGAHLSPDGQTVITTGDWVGRRDLRTGTSSGANAHTLLKDGAYSRDGRYFYAVTLEPGTLAWAVDGWHALPPFGHGQNGNRWIETLADGWVISGGRASGVSATQDRAGHRDATYVMADSFEFSDASVGPDGRLAWLLGPGGALHRLTLKADEVPDIVHVRLRPTTFAVATTPDGGAVVADADGITVLDPEGQDTSRSFPVGHRKVMDLAVSPDGGLIATAERDGGGAIWSAVDGRLVADLRGHTERAVSVSFSADGTTLVTAGWDKRARFWDVGVLAVTADVLAVKVQALKAAWDLSLEDLLVDR
ncbi:MAG: serine/threonine protein kinase/WD40 repeat protein [Myxococcota bacterium]|jgi:serine/threonine protein kinase/WD40 repeat protein